MHHRSHTYFFADDSILFFKATQKKVTTIQNIITTYEEALGQRINMDKLELTISANISWAIMEKLGN
ncbi:hypothetical protein ACS0TY_000488 [Phlomoides rotata]